MSALREAMLDRLGRFLSRTDKDTTTDTAATRELLLAKRSVVDGIRVERGTPHDGGKELSTLEEMSAIFEASVRQWVEQCVAHELRDYVLDDAVFMADRWPIGEAFCAPLFGAQSASLYGLDDPSIVDTHLIEGLVPVYSWPIGADYEAVLRWWAALATEPNETDPWENHYPRVGKTLLDAFLEFKRDAPRLRVTPTAHPGYGGYVPKLWYGVTAELPWLHPGIAAVVYLAEQRARRKVYPDVAARETWRALRDIQKPRLENIARSAITAENASVDVDADRSAIEPLADTLAAHLEPMRAAVGLDEAEPPRGTEEKDGALLVEERFAAYIGGRFGEHGRALASDVRETARARMQSFRDGRTPGGSLWEKWLDDSRLRMFARVLWRDVVAPRFARKLEPVRVPTEAVETMAMARVYGGHHNGTEVLVEPPKGISLTLPFDEEIKVAKRGEGLVSVNRVLTARSLRTYLALLMLYGDGGMRDDGSFEIDGPSTILDAIGAAKRKEKKGDRTYERFMTKDTAAVQSDLALFASIRVRSVGELEAAAGDALVDEIKNRRNGKTVAYAHSRLIVGKLRSDYIRIPRALCRLDADDVPIGMGIALIVRGKVLAHLKNGKAIEAPIGDWVAAAGINARERVRKQGRAFWEDVAEKIASVADEGKLGSVKVTGRGADAVLELDVAQALRESYAPLLEASKAQAQAKRVAMVADKRKRR